MLDLIEASLIEQGMKLCRIDGQSSMSQRKNALERFGNDPEYNIMLASIGAAGEGLVSAFTAVPLCLFTLTPRTRIDLTVANSVHITEPHWNPMAEAQAIDRIHRIGQQRDVEVIRYIISNSIEKVRVSRIT
jgi:SNF2 family DNA or RNA helicase